MEKNKCAWAYRDPLEEAYHDQEWGRPLHDDQKIFEFLVLETMQAGLSWTTILKRREAMRQAFDGFAVASLAQYDAAKEEALLQNPAIIRHRLKIASLRKNAQAFQGVQEEFGSFDAYIWAYVDGKPQVGAWQSMEEVPLVTDLAKEVSKDLKKRGFTFVGPTIVQSFLQAIGLLNDHLVTCPTYQELVTT